MTTYSVALIPGDGIGPEVLREGKKVMDAVAEVAGITWKWKEYPYGAEHWLKHRKGAAHALQRRGHGRAGQARRHLLRRRRRPAGAGVRGAGGRSALDAVLLRPVHQPAARQAPARGRPRPSPTRSPTTSTSSWCARTARTSTSASAPGIPGDKSQRDPGAQAGALQGPVQRGHRPRARRRAGLPDRRHDRPRGPSASSATASSWPRRRS